MTIDEVLKYFKNGYQLRKQTGMSPNNIKNWKAYGYIPIKTQFRLQELTGGELVADINHCKL